MEKLKRLRKYSISEVLNQTSKNPFLWGGGGIIVHDMRIGRVGREIIVPEWSKADNLYLLEQRNE